MIQIHFSTKLTLLFLAMMTMMSNVAVVTTLPLLSNAFKDVENIEFFSRMMITLPSLAIAILAPFLGDLIFRFGKKKSAIIALLFFALTGSAGLYLETIYEILASRFFFGISIAVLMIVSTSLVGDYFKDNARHKFMGMQSAFMSVGGIFFIVGGGLLSDIDWRYPFGIYLVGIVIAIFVSKYLYEVEFQPTNGEEEQLKTSLIPIYFLAFLLMVIFYILPTQIPFLIINVFHASGALTGSIIATAFVFNALGALSFSKLKQRFDFATIYFIGMAIIGVGFICIGFVNDVHYFFITSPIMGFGGGILMTNITAWMLHKAHHTKRVKSSSYLTSSLFMGQFFSPILTYPIVQMLGIENFFEAIGSFILITLIVIALLKKR